jgi:hypothetical protein
MYILTTISLNFGSEKEQDFLLCFYRQLDFIFWWFIISYTCDLHLGPQILSLMKNQPNGPRK